MLNVAFVQLQWNFIFVGAQVLLAQFHQLLDFGFISFAGRQFFDGNLFVEVSGAVKEASLLEETFGEFLDTIFTNQKEKNRV